MATLAVLAPNKVDIHEVHTHNLSLSSHFFPFLLGEKSYICSFFHPQAGAALGLWPGAVPPRPRLPRPPRVHQLRHLQEGQEQGLKRGLLLLLCGKEGHGEGDRHRGGDRGAGGGAAAKVRDVVSFFLKKTRWNCFALFKCFIIFFKACRDVIYPLWNCNLVSHFREKHTSDFD